MMKTPSYPTAVLVMADGTFFEGVGFGAEGSAQAELCFNTSMTGYQEIMTDPSYAGQIITFTFPHIGNTGVTAEDDERASPAARGMVCRWLPTTPSNWRSQGDLDAWLKSSDCIGIAGIDTRRLTRAIRLAGAPHVAIAHNAQGVFDIEALKKKAKSFAGLQDLDLAKDVASTTPSKWTQKRWNWQDSYGEQERPKFKVVAIDYGAKRNILRALASVGCDVTVLPASTTAQEILAYNPDGLFLSNGPGDPAATGVYAVPMIQEVLRAADIPIFGICLGHQMLALALGAKTLKMNHGHHGANHPVKEIATGKVEITSMNHGFAVDAESLPEGVRETHVSLFDGTNCGIEMVDRPVFSVQQHPEASPGPMDSLYLFDRFTEAMAAQSA